jgi:hypothetical protein
MTEDEAAQKAHHLRMIAGLLCLVAALRVELIELRLKAKKGEA